jgi:hypothetical protein
MRIVRHERANLAIEQALDLFERVAGPRCYSLHVSYEATPAVFELTQQQLDEGDPFAWPHHYRVMVVRDFGCWKHKVVDSVVHDLPGAVRALVEGVELGTSDAALNDWMLTRLA